MTKDIYRIATEFQARLLAEGRAGIAGLDSRTVRVSRICWGAEAVERLRFIPTREPRRRPDTTEHPNRRTKATVQI